MSWLPLREQAQDKIRDAILDGTLRPGERLHDEDLLSWLGMSRTPIRQALGALAHEGLIEMIPNRSTRVALPSGDELLSAMQALGIIIGGVVRFTVPVMTTEQKVVTADRLATEIESLRSGAPARDARAGAAAYQGWLDLCPNPSLASVGQQAMQGLAFKLRVDMAQDAVSPCQLVKHLTAFRDAIIAGDSVAAERAVKAAHALGHDGRGDLTVIDTNPVARAA
jgi:DNA-binding GntR family transcriptional regulator